MQKFFYFFCLNSMIISNCLVQYRFVGFFCWYFQASDDYDVQEDLPQALKLLGEMNHNVKQVSDLVESMLQRVKTGELTTEYGLSFLEIKYHMLLTYLINLTYVVLRKCSGTPPKLTNIPKITIEQCLNVPLLLFALQAKQLKRIHRLIVSLRFGRSWRRFGQSILNYDIKLINW